MRKAMPAALLVALVAGVIAVNAIGASASSDAARLEPWGRHLTDGAAQQASAAVAGQRLVLFTRPSREKFVDADDNGRESDMTAYLGPAASRPMASNASRSRGLPS